MQKLNDTEGKFEVILTLRNGRRVCGFFLGHENDLVTLKTEEGDYLEIDGPDVQAVGLRS